MVLKPVLTVEGKEYEVLNLTFYNGEVTQATIYDDGENCIIYYDEDCSYSYVEKQLKLDFSKALRFVAIEQKIASEQEKLIAHLEDVQNEENNKLLEIAIDAMEGEAEEPFALNLANKQQEYKLMQQRVFGIIDTIEEVKAYTEGYYANGNDAKVEA